jgi:hypothetical protein
MMNRRVAFVAAQARGVGNFLRDRSIATPVMAAPALLLEVLVNHGQMTGAVNRLIPPDGVKHAPQNSDGNQKKSQCGLRAPDWRRAGNRRDIWPGGHGKFPDLVKM